MEKSIYDTGYNTTMMLLLQFILSKTENTLVRFVRSSAIPAPGGSQYSHFLNSPLQGGEVFQSTSTSISRVFIPSLEGRQQLHIRKSLKGMGVFLLLSHLPLFFLLAQQATWIWYSGDLEIVLANKVQDRRAERNAFFAVFRKVDSAFNLN